MTYYESYKQMNTVEQIMDEAERDINIACSIYCASGTAANPDRIEAIRRAAEKAINEMEGTNNGDKEAIRKRGDIRKQAGPGDGAV